MRAATLVSAALILTTQAAFAAVTHTVALWPQHGSHEHGKATFVQKGPDVVVTIVVSDMPAGGAPEFAHIHQGRCGDLGAATKYDLEPIRDGRSVTTLKNVSLDMFARATYAVAIHQTLAHVSRHIACGGPIIAAK